MPLNCRERFDLPGLFLCFNIKLHFTLAARIREFISELLKGLQRHFSCKGSVHGTKNSLCFCCELNPYRGAHSPTFSCGNHPHNNTTLLMKIDFITQLWVESATLIMSNMPHGVIIRHVLRSPNVGQGPGVHGSWNSALVCFSSCREF